MAEPQRRETRRPHLDASVVPVKQALLARASALTKAADDPDVFPLEQVVSQHVAAEFLALAEELHWH
jgi:hypothetical protein